MKIALSAAQTTKEEILAHYKEYSYAVIPNALSTEEVAYLNDLVDQDLEKNPDDWHAPSQGARGNGSILMKYPELDRFVRHSKTFPLIQEILGRDARFAQVDFRDVTANLAEESGMHFHRDMPYKTTYVCAIYYLKDVHECCPSFCMVPKSHLYNTLDETKEALGEDYKEVPIRGKAGTAVLYDVTAFHTRKTGTSSCTHGRRTLHNYHSRESNPPLVDWATVPEELAMSEDKETRLFYSQWTVEQIKYARKNYQKIYW